jgi:hypothetical protein
MFSVQTLGALTSAQEGAGNWRQQMDAIVANKMVSQLDTNGDGQLSLSEIENALGLSGGTTSGATGSDASGSSSSTGATDGLSAAFASVDTNGDGELSVGELANALGQLQGHHGHHHHHVDNDDDDGNGNGNGNGAANALASNGSVSTAVPGGSTTGASGSTGTIPTDPTATAGVSGVSSTDPGTTTSGSGGTTPDPTSTTTGVASTTTGSTASDGSQTIDGLTSAEFATALQAFLTSLAQSQAANLNAMAQASSPTSVTA